MIKFAARTIDRSFGIKQETLLVDALGRDSGLTDIFYCHGLVGVVVMLYLNHVVYRKDHYFEMTMHYVSMLTDEDKDRVAREILKQLDITCGA